MIRLGLLLIVLAVIAALYGDRGLTRPINQSRHERLLTEFYSACVSASLFLTLFGLVFLLTGVVACTGLPAF